MLKTVFLSLVILLFGFSLQAQTHAVWGIGDNEDLSFEKGNVILSNPKNLFTGITSSICTYKGELDLHSNWNILYDATHKPVIGWQGIAADSILSLCFLKLDMFRFGIVYMHRTNNDSVYQVLLSEYDKRINGGVGGIVPGRHKLMVGYNTSSDAIKVHDLVKRLYDSKFIIVLRIRNKINLFKYEYGKQIQCKDTLVLLEDFTAPNIPIGFEKFFRSGTQYWISMSHSGNIVTLRTEYNLRKANFIFPNKFDTLIQNYRTITNIKIDRVNLKFKTPNLIYKGSYNYKLDSVLNEIGTNFGAGYYEYSPNDSFYYLTNFIRYGKNGILKSTAIMDSNIYQLKMYEVNELSDIPKSKVLTESISYSIFKLMPDGKIYFTESYWDNLSNSRKYFLHCNQTPNVFNSYNFKINVYPFHVNDRNILMRPLSNRWYDYVKPRISIDYDCDATVRIKNASDLSLKMDKFTWYFSLTPLGNFEDTVIGFEPIVKYTKNGKYPYKVYGYSSTAVYGELYEDTLIINIPQKPVAKFLAIDTVICRYLPLQFKNLSYSLNDKPGSNRMFFWTFGDGSFSTDKEPSHIYSKAGTYTVSLFFSNGYCDSTLVRNQFIRVVDAPTPGFIVDKKYGCTPLTAIFSDTVSLNVTKKEYFFGDSAIWKTISSPIFNYTFSKPGHFWVVQKLSGYTGCIIRTDSIQFIVSKGVTLRDSIQIISASYDTLNALNLQWLSNSSAIKYHVMKSKDGINFSNFAETQATSLVDITNSANHVFYKVIAIDSCGTFSSSLNIVSPSLIYGKNINSNEYLELQHSVAKGFGGYTVNELMGSFNNYSKLENIQKDPVNPFNDMMFANVGYLRKCYRLKSVFSGISMFSNCFCTNYDPKIFIANAFSPNANGLNDEFLPLGLGIESYSMKIYNRWGEIVFSDSKPWDGKLKDQYIPDDVYFYIISITDTNRKFSVFSGSVRVMK